MTIANEGIKARKKKEKRFRSYTLSPVRSLILFLDKNGGGSQKYSTKIPWVLPAIDLGVGGVA